MSWEQVGALIGAVVGSVLLGIGWTALRLKGLHRRVDEAAREVSEIRVDLGSWEKELRAVRGEAQTMRGELQSTRGELQNLRSEMHEHWATMASVKQAILRDQLPLTNSSGALTAGPARVPAPEPVRTASAAASDRERSTASDWLRQETLRRLSG